VDRPPPPRTDRVLLIEAGLVLLLAALGIVLYWRPAAEGFLDPRWWHWMLLAGLFFGIVWLDRWRRQRRTRAALRETLQEERDGR